MTTYDLEIGAEIKVGIPAMVTLMLLLGGGMAVQAIREDSSSALFFVFWFGFVAFFAFQIASTPLHIDDDGRGNLAFRSLLRTRTVQVSEIRSIEPVRGQFGFFRLVHDNGKITFLSQFTGFHRLLGQLAQANPGITLRGC